MQPHRNPPLFLFDLDETLIGRDYSLNVEERSLREAFRRAIANGAVLGLNSDTPTRSLKEKYTRWGMNGPIVAERGAEILTQAGETVDLASPAGEFTKLRDRFAHVFSQRDDVSLRFAHAWDLDETVAQARPDQRLVVINPYRQRSLSFWARRGGSSGAAAMDFPLLQEMVTVLMSLIASEFPALRQNLDDPLDVNPDYCIAVIHSAALRRPTP